MEGDKMDITPTTESREHKAVTAEEIKKNKAKQDFSGELDTRLPQLRTLALEVD